MQRLLFFYFLFFSLNVLAQTDLTKLAQPIVAEGKLLYRTEMASWYGTDLFFANYKQPKNLGGYFSYVENELAKCVFYSLSESPKVIGTAIFDSTYLLANAKLDLVERDFSPLENNLYILRKQTIDLVKSDSLFKFYQNTNFNFIPIITGNEKKVYILTGTQQQGVVILGNDYLLTFDSDNQLITKKAIHQNIIPIEFANGEADVEIVGSLHNHSPETGDFITATDICTLMLYAKFAKWKSHNVISEKYLNIWDCEKNSLVVVPVALFDKIDKEEKSPKEKKEKKKK